MSRSFDQKTLLNLQVGHNLLKLIRSIGEYKGKEALYQAKSPQDLETLRKNAVIQSTESSNRIEGVLAQSPERLKGLVEKSVTPGDRSEQEIAGYRDALNTIHSSYADIELTPNIVLQLHRDLFKYTSETGGKWKASDNAITETKADGSKFVRFQPTSAWQTPEAVAKLHAGYRESDTEPLLAIAAYVLDFLCIHPFRDGNGRMARLLSLLLLYKAGYQVGRYISLEKIVEDTKESYYDALYRSSQGWHEGKHNLTPWIDYFLGVMLLTAYKELDNRVELIATSGGAKGIKGAMVVAAIQKLPMRFSISDIVAQCPTVGIAHIRKVLHSERDAGHIKSVGRGPAASWLKIQQ